MLSKVSSHFSDLSRRTKVLLTASAASVAIMSVYYLLRKKRAARRAIEEAQEEAREKRKIAPKSIAYNLSALTEAGFVLPSRTPMTTYNQNPPESTTTVLPVTYSKIKDGAVPVAVAFVYEYPVRFASTVKEFVEKKLHQEGGEQYNIASLDLQLLVDEKCGAVTQQSAGVIKSKRMGYDGGEGEDAHHEFLSFIQVAPNSEGTAVFELAVDLTLLSRGATTASVEGGGEAEKKARELFKLVTLAHSATVDDKCAVLVATCPKSGVRLTVPATEWRLVANSADASSKPIIDLLAGKHSDALKLVFLPTTSAFRCTTTTSTAVGGKVEQQDEISLHLDSPNLEADYNSYIKLNKTNEEFALEKKTRLEKLSASAAIGISRANVILVHPSLGIEFALHPGYDQIHEPRYGQTQLVAMNFLCGSHVSFESWNDVPASWFLPKSLSSSNESENQDDSKKTPEQEKEEIAEANRHFLEGSSFLILGFPAAVTTTKQEEEGENSQQKQKVKVELVSDYCGHGQVAQLDVSDFETEKRLRVFIFRRPVSRQIIMVRLEASLQSFDQHQEHVFERLIESCTVLKQSPSSSD